MNRIATQSCLLLLFAAAASGQSAPQSSPGADSASPPTRAAAPATTTGPIQFGFPCDGEQVVVEVDGEKWQATVGGKKLAEARARRTGSKIQVFDRDGALAAQVTLFAAGGTVQRFTERQRVALGMRVAVPEPDVARLGGFEPAQVRRILSVTQGQPAQKAGLQVGDMLIEIDGKRPFTEARLRSTLLKKRPGDLLPLVVSRGGQLLNVAVRLEALATFWDREAAEIATKTMPLPPSAPAAPLVHLDGGRMLVVEEPGTAPAARVPGRPDQPQPAQAGTAVPVPARDGGADPIVELRRVQERLEAMERLLQRVLEMREKTERERTEAAKPGAPRRDGK
jgi:membrane-associated protease RseP (regulator of RpoE activity)